MGRRKIVIVFVICKLQVQILSTPIFFTCVSIPTLLRSVPVEDSRLNPLVSGIQPHARVLPLGRSL